MLSVIRVLMLGAVVLMCSRGAPCSEMKALRVESKELLEGEHKLVQVSLLNASGKLFVLCHTQPVESSYYEEAEIFLLRFDDQQDTWRRTDTKIPVRGVFGTKGRPEHTLLAQADEGSYLVVYQHGSGSGYYGFFPTAAKATLVEDTLSFDPGKGGIIGEFKKTDMSTCDRLGACALSNGDILVVGAQHSDMWSSISSDGGESWTPLVMLEERGSMPRIVRSGDKVLLLYWRWKMRTSSDGNWCLYTEETSDGKEWIRRRQVAKIPVSREDVLKATAGEGEAGVLAACSSPDRAEVFVLYRLVVAGEPHLYLRRSDQDGARWSEPVELITDIGVTPQLSVTVADGSLVIVFGGPDGEVRYGVLDIDKIPQTPMIEVAPLPTAEDIKKQNDADRAVFLKRLQQDDLTDHERQKTTVRLISIGDASCVPLLLDQLKGDYHTVVKQQTMRALGAIGDRRAVPALIEILEQPVVGDLENESSEAILRRHAVRALEKIGDPAALPVLEKIVASTHEYQSVRERAGIAIRRIKEKQQSH